MPVPPGTRSSGHSRSTITGLTHVAVRDDSQIVIQWMAGHGDYELLSAWSGNGKF
jgi:hypothetical protein